MSSASNFLQSTLALLLLLGRRAATTTPTATTRPSTGLTGTRPRQMLPATPALCATWCSFGGAALRSSAPALSRTRISSGTVSRRGVSLCADAQLHKPAGATLGLRLPPEQVPRSAQHLPPLLQAPSPFALPCLPCCRCPTLMLMCTWHAHACHMHIPMCKYSRAAPLCVPLWPGLCCR